MTNFGKKWHFSQESKEKLRLSNTGKKHKLSEEGRKKIILINKKRKGKKWSEEQKARLSLILKGRGKRLSEETKNKIRISNTGKHLSEYSKNKLREYAINNPNRIFKNTKIEIKVENELIKRGINYQKQVPLCRVAIVDFYLPEYRIIIQADGDYWHNKPGVKEKDERQDRVLTFNGFNVYRFCEHEINESVKNCIDKLKLEV